MIETEEKNSRLIEYFESKGYSSIAVNGYKIINLFTSLEKEIDSLYNGVALRNISHYGIIELKGKDVLDFLHRISTNSLKELAKEQLKTTLFTTEKGRIIDQGTLINFEDYQLVICGRENKQKVMSWINKYVISDDVQVNDGNSKYNLLELSGPQAESFVTIIGGKTIGDIEPDSFRIMHTENMLFFLLKISAERNLNKFWFLADYENTKKLIEYMNAHVGPFDFNFVGEKAYNTYRIEQGIPSANSELNDNYNPLEAGLERFIDFEKGCYIGQEVIARLDTYDKVQKRLTGVLLSESINTQDELALLDEKGNQAGVITSSSHSIKLNEQIGLAYVKNSHLKSGTNLKLIADGNKEVTAEVHSVPFF